MDKSSPITVPFKNPADAYPSSSHQDSWKAAGPQVAVLRAVSGGSASYAARNRTRESYKVGV